MPVALLGRLSAYVCVNLKLARAAGAGPGGARDSNRDPAQAVRLTSAWSRENVLVRASLRLSDESTPGHSSSQRPGASGTPGDP